jgi:hypothetical protein
MSYSISSAIIIEPSNLEFGEEIGEGASAGKKKNFWFIFFLSNYNFLN